jgi:hypothetical protein
MMIEIFWIGNIARSFELEKGRGFFPVYFQKKQVDKAVLLESISYQKPFRHQSVIFS